MAAQPSICCKRAFNFARKSACSAATSQGSILTFASVWAIKRMLYSMPKTYCINDLAFADGASTTRVGTFIETFLMKMVCFIH